MRMPVLNGMYEVSDSGEVFSKYRNRYLTGGVYPNGYEFVGLTVNGETKNYMRHRLVALAFIPNPDELPYVNHIDGNKRNNNVENLEWCTALENVQHAIRTGLVERICKIERQVSVHDLDTNRVIKFQTIKECCDFFGHTKCWLGNYQRKHGNPCTYLHYVITISERRKC